MAAHAHIGTQSIVEALTTRASRYMDQTAERFARYRVYRKTLEELRALSDRELADLGMHRGGLKAIAADAAQRDSAL